MKFQNLRAATTVESSRDTIHASFGAFRTVKRFYVKRMRYYYIMIFLILYVVVLSSKII